MEERQVALRVRGADRFYVDRGLQIFIVERKDILKYLKDNAPTGFRGGVIIEGVRKADPMANHQESVAYIATPNSSVIEVTEYLLQYVEESKEFAAKVEQMDMVIVYYPRIDTKAFWILVD